MTVRSPTAVDDRRLVFIHVPKTGGTTLRRIIERQFGRRAVWVIGPQTAQDIDRLINLPRRKLDTIRAIVGHHPFGLHDLLPWPVAYVTLLREPVDRIVSHFYYASRTVESPLHAEVAATGNSLDGYVESAPSRSYFNNGQTRLVGSADAREAAPAQEETLAVAKQRLGAEFALIGLTERFDESVASLRRIFGWRDVGYRREKIGDNRPPLSSVPAATRQIILRHNQLDADLYRSARELFNDRLRALV
jgi:hypothetical protein